MPEAQRLSGEYSLVIDLLGGICESRAVCLESWYVVIVKKVFCPTSDAFIRTGQDSKDALQSDNSLQQATSELRTLLERFANGMSLSVIGDAMKVLYEDSKQDEELRDWFRAVDSYVRKVGSNFLPMDIMI